MLSAVICKYCSHQLGNRTRSVDDEGDLGSGSVIHTHLANEGVVDVSWLIRFDFVRTTKHLIIWQRVGDTLDNHRAIQEVICQVR